MHHRFKIVSFIALSIIFITCSTRETTSSSEPDELRLYPIKENGKWGFMDVSGKVLVQPTFDYVWDFSGGLGRFKINGKYGFVNATGEVVVQPALTYADDFTGEYTRVNTKDTLISEVTFDGYYLFGNWSYMNKNGIVFNESFYVAEPVRNGYGSVKDVNDYNAPFNYVSFENGTITRQDRIAKAIFTFNGHTVAPASDSNTGKIGLIDENEQWVVFPSFDQIQPMSEGLAAAKKDNLYGYIDVKGTWIYQRIVPTEEYAYLGSDFESFSNGLAAVKLGNEQYGYITKEGKIAFNEKFKNAYAFNKEGYAIVTTDAGQGIIDKKGAYAIRPGFDIQSVEKNIVIYKTTEGFGVRNLKTNEDIIKPAYSGIKRTGELLQVTNTGASNGYINMKGEFVIAPQFNTAWDFNNGKAVVSLKEKLVYIDKTGKVLGAVPDSESPYAYRESKTMYAVSDPTGKFGYSKTDFEGMVIPAAFDFATDFEGTIARVNIGAGANEEYYGYQGGKWGLVNEKGETILAPSFELILPFSNGVAIYNVGGEAVYNLCEEECEDPVFYNCDGGKWGLLDITGKKVTEASFDRIIPFGDNFIAKQGDTYGLINGKGETLYPFQLTFNFEDNGYMIEKTNSRSLKAIETGRAGVLGNTGKWIINPHYEDVDIKNEESPDSFHEGFVLIKQNNKWSAINREGIVHESAFEKLEHFSNGFAAFMQDGKWGFIDQTGAIAVQPVYASVRSFQGNVAIVQKEAEGLESVINKNGETVFEPSGKLIFEYEGFVNGRCIVRTDQSWQAGSTCGVIDDQGKMIFNINALSDVKIQAEGFLYVSKNGKWALATKDGAMLTGFDYSWIEPLNGQDLIRVNVGGEVATSDYEGNEYAFNGLWGFIDKTGKLKVPVQFAEVGPFSDGLASAQSGKDLAEIGYFDLQGQPIRQPAK